MTRHAEDLAEVDALLSEASPTDAAKWVARVRALAAEASVQAAVEPEPDFGRMAAVALWLKDMELYADVVRANLAHERIHYRLQQEAGVGREARGPYPSLGVSARRVRLAALLCYDNAAPELVDAVEDLIAAFEKAWRE